MPLLTKQLSGGDIVVRALEDEGIPFTFGIPGTHNIELYDSLSRSASVRPILVTDEQSASFMADAVSRSSDKLGCANLVPGAGLTHALSGIAEAFMDNTAVLVLGCGVRSDTGKAYQLHDIDQTSVIRPVSKAQLRPQAGSEIYATIRTACQIARTPPAGPVFVEIPVDHYLFRHEPRLDSWVQQPVDLATLDPDALNRVLALIAKSRRPLLYLGNGATAAGDDLAALAERLNSPVATTIQGKGVLPESHPLWLWCGFGAAAPPFVRRIASTCDLMLAIGCRFSEVGTGSYGLEPPGPLIHVDIDAEVLGRNYETAVALEADASSFVRALLAELPQRQPAPDLRESIEQGHRKLAAAHGEPDPSAPVSPPLLLSSLQKVYGRDAIYTSDSGNGTFLAMEWLRLERSRSFLAPVDYSCMGYSVPAAIGAALASPQRPVVALAGDGAFLMTGLELLTAAHLQLPLTILVLRDRKLAQIAQFQETALARQTASLLPDFDLEALSKAIGIPFLCLGQNDQVLETLTEARRLHESGRPVLVEVRIDYSEPTFFTRGVVRANLGRLPWQDRLRFVSRAIVRRLPGGRT